MAELSQYDPFTDLLENLGRGMFLAPLHTSNKAMPQIKMDLAETADAYTLRAELPGVRKEDIEVSLHGNEVSIRGEIKQEKSEKQNDTVIRQERHHGTVYRGLTLQHEIDDAAAQAKYVDGVLELTLPKKAGSSAKRLIIG